MSPAAIRGAAPASASAPEPDGSTLPPWVRPTSDEIEAYEERAAIIQYDGGLKRKAAEKLALERLLQARQKGGGR